MSANFEQVLARDGKLVYICVGTSMMPMLRQRRDLLIIERPRGPLQKYDVPLFKRDSGKYVLHRVLKVGRDGYVLCGDNQWRREYGVTDGQIIGVLTAFVRDGKEISVTDRRYRLYVHLWCDPFWLRAAVLRSLAALDRIRRRLKKHPDKTPESGGNMFSSVQDIESKQVIERRKRHEGRV